MVEPAGDVRVKDPSIQSASITLFDAECGVILSEAWFYLLKVDEENECGDEAA